VTLAATNLSIWSNSTLIIQCNILFYNIKMLFDHKMTNPGPAQQAGGVEAHTKNLCSNLSTEIVDNWEPEIGAGD
jgi:hypothetical protein